MISKLLSAGAPATTEPAPDAAAGEYLTEPQYCALVHIVPKTAQRQRATGEGPPFIRMGARRVLYRRSDVDAYLESRTFRHRAEEAVAQHAT